MPTKELALLVIQGSVKQSGKRSRNSGSRGFAPHKESENFLTKFENAASLDNPAAL